MFELGFTILTHVVAMAVGVWGYRYMAKRNPELVTQWATDLNAAGKKVEGFFQ